MTAAKMCIRDRYKRQKVKRYRRSFYSRGTRIKKGIGIVVLVLAVLGAAWLAAPHVLDLSLIHI